MGTALTPGSVTGQSLTNTSNKSQSHSTPHFNASFAPSQNSSANASVNSSAKSQSKSSKNLPATSSDGWSSLLKNSGLDSATKFIKSQPYVGLGIAAVAGYFLCAALMPKVEIPRTRARSR